MEEALCAEKVSLAPIAGEELVDEIYIQSKSTTGLISAPQECSIIKLRLLHQIYGSELLEISIYNKMKYQCNFLPNSKNLEHFLQDKEFGYDFPMRETLDAYQCKQEENSMRAFDKVTCQFVNKIYKLIY